MVPPTIRRMIIHQNDFRKSLTVIKMTVGMGRACFISSKTCVTLGTIKVIRKIRIKLPIRNINTGYARAALILPARACCFSLSSAKRLRTTSSVPDASPARIMLI